MHSLEQEYLELRAAGVVSEASAARVIALDSGELFSVFGELRVALYLAVAAVMVGIGILINENLDHIGPLVLVLALALVAAVCYGVAIRTRLRQQVRSLGGDYLLLLGALILSADLGYAESQFHWLGVHWSWYLPLLVTLHAITAYALGSRLVLSLALSSLAAGFGVDLHVSSMLQVSGEFSDLGIQALSCACLIVLWRLAHQWRDGNPSFIAVFEHFAVNLAFWGTLTLCFIGHTRPVGVALLLLLAALSIFRGVRSTQEAFIVYGVLYTALGACVVEIQVISSAVAVTAVALVTVISAIVLLWSFHQQLRRGFG